ncbi:hypothetical protein BJ508DRAFT_415372 [Ascobolus immersus RN42]|uniref:T6SS Phospholipase effector Tle1-like catalytic domain-containing protein n=1 Tax=Ascobolus immersus RN42 TaxID=1160509 RepID=A0A3N4I529_ASCIM|nr:hypothetical protein BJ508DRAFT_415372 [Ascobolus immersus RN42]
MASFPTTTNSDLPRVEGNQKRIILLCDGTGNSCSRRNERATNVKRFLDIITPTFKGERSTCTDATHEKDTITKRCRVCKTVPFVGQQVVYYQSGVGTGTDMGDLSLNYSKGTGSGINDNILDAYCWLATNYTYGDEIFIFGFSRGAFTARVVANLVVQLGLFHKNRMYMLQKAWAQYTKNDANWDYFKTQLWEKHYQFTRPVSIRVLGVWDTVGAVGMPDYMPAWANSQQFHQSNVLNGIDFVFHALALDEYRRTFGPTMFYLPDVKKKREYRNMRTGMVESFGDTHTFLKQCWFAGAHSNVRGSYPSEHIADVSLAWMIDQCCIYGHLLSFDTTALYLIVERHHNPSRNISNLYKDAPTTYRGWGAGPIYNSFNSSSESKLGVGFITYQYRAPGIYPPSKHPGPTGIWTPKPADQITWKDYEDSVSGKVWNTVYDASSIVGTYLGWGIKKVKQVFSDQEVQEREEREYNRKFAQIQDNSATAVLAQPLREEPTDKEYVPPYGRQYCERNECCHPARRGRYLRVPLQIPKQDGTAMTVQFPLFESERRFATCETMHGTVFARYKRVADINNCVDEKERQINLHEALYRECSTKPLGIWEWDPAALFPFKWEEGEQGRPMEGGFPAKYGRYRREEIFPGGPVIWTGKCPFSKLYFEMLEEPDSHYAALGDLKETRVLNNLCRTETDQRYWSLRRLQVDDMMLRLNNKGIGGKKNELHMPLFQQNEPRLRRRSSTGTLEAHPVQSDSPLTPPPSRSWKEESLTDEQLEERYMDSLYLEDDFDVKHEETLRKARFERWNEIKSCKEKFDRYKSSLNFSRSIEGEYRRIYEKACV